MKMVGFSSPPFSSSTTTECWNFSLTQSLRGVKRSCVLSLSLSSYSYYRFWTMEQALLVGLCSLWLAHMFPMTFPICPSSSQWHSQYDPQVPNDIPNMILKFPMCSSRFPPAHSTTLHSISFGPSWNLHKPIKWAKGKHLYITFFGG